MIADALRQVGAARSIVIDEDNVVLAGNGVTAAAADAGITKVRIVEAQGDEVIAVRRSGLSADQKRALALFDNRTAELATWDAEQLRADLEAGLDLQPYFFPEELQTLLGSVAKSGRTDPDAVPAVRATEIQRGDLFELGAHRLLCGDSLDPQDVDRLVPPSDRVATLVTSPPYWTGQPYDNKPGEAGVRAFIERCAETWAPRVRRRIQIQTGHTNTTLVGETGPWHKILLDGIWAAALQQHGWLLRHRRVWAKGGGNLPIGPIGDLIDESWEVIATFYRDNQNEGGQERMSEGWAQMGVWSDIPGEDIDGHPCPFPVAIADRLIRLYSVSGDTVADPFAGSGTTLIAAEQLGRACRALEIEPAYCQVILDRWEAFTGQRAQKVGEAIRG